MYGYQTRRFTVDSRWFRGGAPVRTFALDELLATKFRALYQRRRGRDLFDLRDACRRAAVDPARVVAAFEADLDAEHLRVTRAEFERNLAAKARHRIFLSEVTPLLAPGIAYNPVEGRSSSCRRIFIERLPGAPWKGR